MMRIDKKHDGQSLIAWIVLTPFVLILISVLFCETNKAYWDYRVTKMCEKDGGVEIFEYIEVTAKEFERFGGNQHGELDIPFERYRNPTDLYYIRFSETISYKLFTLTIGYSITEIIRVKDKKVMSRMISYGRAGGDFPTGIGHSSYFSCSEINKFNSRLIKSTVQIKGY